jgi:beta-glucanase (GH16 family)
MYKQIDLFFCISLVLSACALSISTPLPTSTPQPTATPASQAWEREGWNMVWHDEFEGSELDHTNWTFDIGSNGWGNEEWETYTDKPENVRVENGILIIEAMEDAGLPAGQPYSSARIKTQGLHSWQYGRIEARIKLPYGQGIWPAFWMLGDNNKIWPATGEIDIMEFIGKEPNTIHATVHAPGYSGGGGVTTSINVPGDTLQNDFHIYAVEWELNEIRWYFDDQEYFKLTPEDVPSEWIFDHEFFIIMNLAVGGIWPGYPDDTTVFPQQMLVDYVRVYQRP